MKNVIITFILTILLVQTVNSQIIVLDPGHGYCPDCSQNCQDNNIRTADEILTAVSVGNKTKVLLDNGCPSVTTYMTRTTSNCGDYPSLAQRSTMSNNWNADRFLSIHCNGGGGTGTSTFWCDLSAAPNQVAEDYSVEIQANMVNYGAWFDRRVVEDDSFLSFHLGVLRNTNAAGCLSEIGFVDTPADLVKLLDDGWRDQFALAYYVSFQNDLNISCSGNIPAFDCSNTIPLTCGVTYNGVSSTDASLVGTYGCNNWSETGPERVHSVVASANGKLKVELSNYTGDLDVYILGSCDPTDCLGTVFSDSAVYNSAIAGQTYYLVVDADDGSGSAYDILVTCPNSISTEDITISNAVLSIANVSAGQSLSVSADLNYSGGQIASNVVDIDIAYYLSTDCNLSVSDTILNFSTEDIGSDNITENVTSILGIPSTISAGNYFILFVGDNGNNLAESNENNNIVCVPITIDALTLDCNTAISLTCGVSYSGVSSTANSIVGTYGCNTWTETGPERVHAITPSTRGMLTVKISNYTGDLDVYILGSCDPTDCLGTVFSDSAVYNSAIAGQTYYLVVDADDGSGSAYDIIANCAMITDVSTNTVTNFNKIVLYPNPTTGIVSIETANQQINRVEVFNTLGKLLDVFMVREADNTIDISAYPSGFYFFKVIGDKEQKVIKVIKE